MEPKAKNHDKRNSFIFYRSFKECLCELSDAEKLVMYEAISDYSLDMIEPNLDGFPNALFKLIRPILDSNTQRWKNGCKGGAPSESMRGNQNAKKQTENKPITNRKQTENKANKDKELNKDNELNENKDSLSEKSRRFIPPSLSEVEKYISDNNFSVNANTFLDFYSSKGWMVGKNKMKDWKAAVRTWQRNDRSKQQRPEEVGITLKDNSVDKFDNETLW